MNEIAAEEVLDEGTCECGQPYMVLKIKGKTEPVIMHKRPACERYTGRKSGAAFLAELEELRIARGEGGVTGMAPVTPQLNRKQRRAQHSARKGPGIAHRLKR